VIDADATYTVSAFLSSGHSILGMRVGYLGGFVPFTGAVPAWSTRVLPVGRSVRSKSGS